MSSPPTGTVTFLFTDIEGSTKLAQAHPAEWPALQARHHAILHAAIESHHGHVFKIIGDAFCVAFATALDALVAAVHTQRSIQAEAWGETPIRVRMGLHTGAAEFHDGDYQGYLTLAHVQRVMSAGYGGQVLLSNATTSLLIGQLPEGVTLRDMGEFRLKGLLNPERLWQLVSAGLLTDFPPLQSLNAIPNNLPIQVTSFVGRELELSELHRLLLTTRLLTLTGSGGTGKTRLSLQVAAEVLETFKDGVWFIELAPLADPALVPQTVATVLGVREEPGRPILATLLDWLRARQLLLILDNCEHLIEACAKFADAVLHADRETRILASSREALAIAGETAYRVPSLACPSAAQAHSSSIEQLTHYAAVQLFIERATQSQTSFAVTNANAPAVAQICYRLDGIPLAIELAAARVKALSVEQIAERLDDRFRLLTGGSRTALPRQQTLRALIDWSYSLLTELERIFLRRLAVFSGGWTLEAAEDVCADANQALNPSDTSGQNVIVSNQVLDLIARLVDKSLVILDTEHARYRLLETVRQFAHEKLFAAGEGTPLKARHLAFFARLANEFHAQSTGSEQVLWLNRVEADHDNVRSAIEWSLESGDVLTGMRLIADLHWFWPRRYTTEAREYLRALVSHPAGAGHTSARAWALYSLGYLEALYGNEQIGTRFLAEALEIATEIGDERAVAHTLEWLGLAAKRRQDNSNARTYLTQALAIFRRLDDRWGIGSTLHNLGAIVHADGELQEAEALYLESVSLLRPLGEKIALSAALRRLGQAMLLRGDLEHAGAFIRESLMLNHELDDQRAVAACLAAAAAVWAKQGRLEDAAQICGATDALLDALHTQMLPYDQEQYALTLNDISTRLKPADFAAAWAAGRALTLEQAIALALHDNP